MSYRKPIDYVAIVDLAAELARREGSDPYWVYYPNHCPPPPCSPEVWRRVAELKAWAVDILYGEARHPDEEAAEAEPEEMAAYGEKVHTKGEEIAEVEVELVAVNPVGEVDQAAKRQTRPAAPTAGYCTTVPRRWRTRLTSAPSSCQRRVRPHSGVSPPRAARVRRRRNRATLEPSFNDSG